MSTIVLLVICVSRCAAVLTESPQNKSAENVQGPVSKITESLKGSFDQKLLIDHRKYDGPDDDGFKERSDEDINYTYPEDVQLVPQVPVTPDSPKYALVPIKKLPVGQAYPTDQQNNDVQTVEPTIPSDFEEEIAKIRIPHIGLPGYITDPLPPREEEEDEEDEEDNEEENNDVPNNDNYFTNDFLEPPEFKDTVRPTRPHPVVKTIRDQGRDIRFIIRNRPDPKKPLIITTSFPLFATNERFHIKGPSDEDSEEIRQLLGFTSMQSEQEFSQSHLPDLLPPTLHHQPVRQHYRRPPLLHYGPPSPVPLRPAYPVRRPVRPSMPRVQSQRVYVRYPRHYRYYPAPGPPRYNRVKVMTQNFVQHPRNYYRNRTPLMMSTAEFRAVKPAGKKKKKKKAKGECKPKKIIKEIHFHHYDPQLSAQLAPLEGINFKEGEDYENDIKVITKETEIKDDVEKGHEDYEQHNENLEKEMDRHKAETEHRLTHPEQYSDSYNPHYSDSGSVEYIDYNIKTDSESSIREPHPAHEYPDERVFNTQRSFGMQAASSNITQPYTSPPPLQGGRYVKHQVIKYYYKTPNSDNH